MIHPTSNRNANADVIVNKELERREFKTRASGQTPRAVVRRLGARHWPGIIIHAYKQDSTCVYVCEWVRWTDERTEKRRASVCVVAVDTRRRRRRRFPRRPHVLYPPTDGSRTRPVFCLSGHAPFIVPRDTSAIYRCAQRERQICCYYYYYCVYLDFCCWVVVYGHKHQGLIKFRRKSHGESKVSTKYHLVLLLLLLLLCLLSRRTVNAFRRNAGDAQLFLLCALIRELTITNVINYPFICERKLLSIAIWQA